MISDHEQIGQALDILTRGIAPYVEKNLREAYGAKWIDSVRSSFRNDKTAPPISETGIAWDAQAVLTVMWDHWNEAFRSHLGLLERSFVSELREFRNRWAHQSQFTYNDSYRVFDTIDRLLTASGINESHEQIERQKLDIIRSHMSRHIQAEQGRARQERQRWLDVILYWVCCLAITATAFSLFGRGHPGPTGTLVGFVIFSFAFFTYQRLRSSEPIYGVHECQKCRKIIYTEVCPYCELPSNTGVRPPS